MGDFGAVAEYCVAARTAGQTVIRRRLRHSPGESMSPKLLQVNYKFTGTRAEYEAANLPWGQPFAEMRGLRWKIWLMNEAEGEAGGIVLFDNEAARQAYIDGPVAEAQSDPTVSNVTYKLFDVLDELSAITRGPLVDNVRG
jgi:hypothetical protein